MRSDRVNEMQSDPETATPLPQGLNGHAKRQNCRPMFHLLAAFTLVTVLMSLYFSHHMLTIHSQSVQQNRLWMNRLGEYVELSRFASNILVPIRSVFTSHEVGSEQARMRHAYERFATHRHELRRDLESHVEPATAAPLLEDLDMIDDSVSRIVEEGNRLYTAFAQRDFDKADRLLTRVVDLHRDIHDLLAFLRDDVRLIQQRQYDARQAEISRLQKYGVLMTMCVLLVVCWIILRERQRAKLMWQNAEEKERDHERIRGEEARMRTIVDSIADGIITLSPDGRIGSWNKAAEHIFGYTKDKIIGNHFCILLASPDRETFATAFQAGDQGRLNLLMERFEILGQRHDGSAFPLDIHLSEMQLGEQRFLAGILSDSTTRQRVGQSS